MQGWVNDVLVNSSFSLYFKFPVLVPCYSFYFFNLFVFFFQHLKEFFELLQVVEGILGGKEERAPVYNLWGTCLKSLNLIWISKYISGDFLVQTLVTLADIHEYLKKLVSYAITASGKNLVTWNWLLICFSHCCLISH